MLFALRRLIPAAFRALVRIVFFAVLFVVLGGGAVLAVAYANRPHWPPDSLTIAAAVAIALLAGYAAALTTLVREVIRGLRDAERDVVRGVEGEVEHAEHAHA